MNHVATVDDRLRFGSSCGPPQRLQKLPYKHDHGLMIPHVGLNMKFDSLDVKLDSSSAFLLLQRSCFCPS